MKSWRCLPIVLAVVFPFLALFNAGAHAQAYPAKPVRIVVPFPPGGGVDLLARALGIELTRLWGQPVIVDNRGGANSIIGAEIVAKAAPDGYTLMMTVNQTITTNPFLYKTLPYDAEKSFAPVSLLAEGGTFVLAHSSLAASNLRELVALARREPGKLNYASYGSGTNSNLLFEMMKKREGIDLVHVPYKGIAPAINALVAGEVQLLVVSSGSAIGQIKSGRIKPLAITAKARSPLFPDVPSSVEAGYPYMLAGVWLGMFAPAGISAAVLEVINRDVNAIARAPAFADKQIISRGWDVVASSPAQFAAAIREETGINGEMFKAADIKPE